MENNKQQTPIEWQHIELSKFLEGKSEFTDAHDILIKAKEMEKERLEKAYDAGHCDGHDACYGHGATYQSFNDYYNETYGGGGK